ncbi:glycerophosphodiester phosphodiesterase family protein [Mucilaginibacter sp. Bleaf8]|uniref:glycerophosphodiester phosphodiesterase family protein n=1 Tax=Mucilaginibacter sp. Bleaf8 TaxID=2834430 RepID=UPI001BCC369F|nr:glycerophosphodiester phosphodiesterase family protein [Mucilaginibacter sp. Bleaf8]MBS7567071.1 glycerophosphodiester phosphodiesterase family protein [Mucilaginibacter sp. Bleaf8]
MLLATKRFLLLFVALVSAGFVYGQPYLLKFKSVNELQQFMQWSPNRMPLVSCHRGGPAPGYPENAIETFAHSVQYHPSIIECDASLTKDSALVMMHDDRLERTTNGAGYVRDKTAAELKSVLLKDNEGTVTSYHIPTLDEVLQWGKNKVLFTLDVKRGVPYRMIVDAVRRNKAEAYSIVITYSANQAAEVHQLAPDLMISASVRSVADLERLNKMGVPNNRIVAFIGTSAADKSVYDDLHSKGIWCILGTMGNLDNSAKANGDKLYSRLIKEGADILSTDRAIACGNELLQLAKAKD